MKLFMNPISSPNIPPNGQTIQILRVQNSQETMLKMRFKIAYVIDNNQNVHDVGEITFPDIEE